MQLKYVWKKCLEQNKNVFTMKYYVNENIKETPRVFPKQGRASYLRYDANENSEGLPAKFVQEVLSEITPSFIAMYPEPSHFLKKYSEYLGVGIDNVYATNGSDHGIRVLLETFGEPGKDVITVSPTFEIYWVCCKLLGLNHKAIPYDNNLTISVESIIDNIDYNTRIVVLLNPNSPIGYLFTEDEVELVIKKAQTVGAVVIIDEAYHYFYDITFLNKAITYENVVLLRTFSKVMSIAGLRIGTIIGHPDLIHYVRNSRLAYELNSVGLLFAERLIDHPEIIKDLIQREREGKQYLISKLKEKKYWFMDCHGNYVLIKPQINAQIVAQRLASEKNILVHPYNNAIMKDLIRVTTGSIKLMEQFLNGFLDIDK